MEGTTSELPALGREGSGRRLAILVSADEAHRLEAVVLQGLLEAESFAGWHGEIVERAQLDVVLREQRPGRMRIRYELIDV